MYQILVLFICGAVLTEGGFIRQPSYNVRLSYPAVSNRQVFVPTTGAFNSRIVQEVPVSYSLSHSDYLFLQHHKTYGKDSPYNIDTWSHDNPLTANLDVHNVHRHIEQNIHNNKNGATDSDDALKKNVANNLINGNQEFVTANVPEKPIVTKHVYFHLPPPEFEEEPAPQATSPPPKKNYNILFIKVPSQEPNFAQIQQLLQSRQPVEDKTLIYVLSKKPETAEPVVLPPNPVLPPEVFYVNYKTKNRDITNISSELGEPDLLQTIGSVLEHRHGDERP